MIGKMIFYPVSTAIIGSVFRMYNATASRFLIRPTPIFYNPIIPSGFFFFAKNIESDFVLTFFSQSRESLSRPKRGRDWNLPRLGVGAFTIFLYVNFATPWRGNLLPLCGANFSHH